MTNYEQNESYLLSNIPITSNYILEIGCGNGSLGYKFKKKQPLVKYYGIEKEQNNSLIAKKRLDVVYNYDLKDTTKLKNKIPPLDCLIYNQTLEIIKDPWKNIPYQLEWLKDNGVVIAFIQNIQHWSIIQELLSESFQKEKIGIYPENIQGLFTLKGIKNLLEDNGFNICLIKPIVNDFEKTIEFTKQIGTSLNNLKLNQNTFISNIAPKQFLVVAKKGKYKRFHIDILKSKVNPPVIAESRINVPFNALNTLPDISNRIGEQIKIYSSSIKIPKIMVLNRLLEKKDENSLNRVRTLLKNEYIIIIDLDDDPSEFLEKDQKYNFSLSSCHAIQVSTNEIARKISHLNPEIKVFSNVIDEIGHKKNEIDNNSDIKIFFGALNRKNDWSPWIDSLNQGLSLNKKRWRFEVVYDELFYNSIRLPATHKKFNPLCTYSRYLDIMSKCDICFMPLLDNSFNRCKSDLKALEAASHSLAILANPVIYNKTFKDGESARFFNDSDTLISILQNWEKNPKRIREIGIKAREYVFKNRLASQQVKKREEWYKNLWERRNEINKAILEREPELNNS